MDEGLYQSDPREYTLEMVAMGMSADHMLLCALKYMSHEDVRGMLDANEMSPRFTDDDDDDDGDMEIVESPRVSRPMF